MASDPSNPLLPTTPADVAAALRQQEQPQEGGLTPKEVAAGLKAGGLEVAPTFHQNSIVGAFTKGIAESALSPLKAVGLEPKFKPTDRPVAEGLGKLAGIGIAFVPFVKGADLAIAGVGLADGESLSTAAEALRGGLSFGGYEATQAKPGERTKGFVKGFGLGAAIDPIASKAIEKIFGGAAAAGRDLTKPSFEEEVKARMKLLPPPDLTVDPAELSMERALSPLSLKHFPMIRQMSNLISEPKSNIDDVLARISSTYRPGGMGLTNLLTYPGDILPKLKELTPEGTRFYFRKDGAQWKMLTVDEGRAIPRLVGDIVTREPSTWTEAEEKLVRRWRGEDVKLSSDDIMSIIEKQVNLVIGSRRSVAQSVGSMEGFGGKYWGRGEKFIGRLLAEKPLPGIDRSKALIATVTEGDGGPRPEANLASLLTHEYSHHVHHELGIMLGSATSKPNMMEMLAFLDGYKGENLVPADKLSEYMVKATAMEQELEAITREAEVRSWMDWGWSREEATPKVNARIEKKPGYYGQTTEQLSRLTEMLWRDPEYTEIAAPESTKMWMGIIRKTSPEMDNILTTEEKTIREVLHSSVKEEPRGVFANVKPTMSPEQIAQWKATGKFNGMHVYTTDGNEWEIEKQLSKSALRHRGQGGPIVEKQYRLVNPLTGEKRIAAESDLIEPTTLSLGERNSMVLRKIDDLLKQGPQDWVGVTMLDKPVSVEGGKVSRYVKTGRVNLRNFVKTDDVESWYDREAKRAPKLTQGRKVLPYTPERARQLASLLGKDGILENSYGGYTVHLANPDALELASDAVQESIDQTYDGVIGDRVIPLSFRSATRGLLREAGVTERDLPHYMRVAGQRFGKSLREIVDPEVKQAVESATKAAEDTRPLHEKMADKIGEIASTAGFKLKEQNGLFDIHDIENGTKVAGGLDLEETLSFLKQAGPKSEIDLSATGERDPGVNAALGAVDVPAPAPQVPPEAVPPGPGSPVPPRPQEQLFADGGDDYEKAGFFKNLVEGSQIIGAFLTNMEDNMKLMEQRGLGPLYTRVFKPLQDVARRVDVEMARMPREALGGRTYNSLLQDIYNLQKDIPKSRWEKVVDYMEFMTRPEVKKTLTLGDAGRGMTDEEVSVANELEKLGVHHEVPRLLATNKLINKVLENRSAFLKRVMALNMQEVDPDLRGTIEELKALAEADPSSRAELMGQMRLSSEEQQAINLLQTHIKRDPNEFSLYAVSRYADAPEMPSGFSSGKAWFAKAHNMTKDELALAEKMRQLYDAGFKASGLDPEREVAGYFPHMRKLIASGFTPDEPFIRRSLPSSFDWAHGKFRTGELNVYQKDPTAVSVRYIRSLLRKKYMDPVMPDVIDALKEVRHIDHRAWRIGSAYVDEMLGRPHGSFTKLQEVVMHFGRAFGVDVNPDIARKAVNIMTSLAYGATIPFRPALIARNYFQSAQTIIPRIGARDFYEGLRRAVADKGYQIAREGGAIPENVVPLHATSELFPEGSIVGRLGFGQKLDFLVKKGFDWYRSADDFGRAIAYHGQSARIERNLGDLINEKISWREFADRSKISTFKPIDQAEIKRLILEDHDYQGAKDYAGSALSRETIFRYGHANHPAGWNSVYGRLFGQFGTWPVQFKDYLAQGLTQGTLKDKIEFAMWNVGINAAVLAAGAPFGANLMSWVTFPSLTYTGGPYASMFMNLVQAVGGTGDTRRTALRNLEYNLPTLKNPQSIFLPLSYLVGDFAKFVKNPSPQGSFEALGFKFYQPGESGPFDFLQGH